MYMHFILMFLHLNLINCLQTPNNVEKLYFEKWSKVSVVVQFELSSFAAKSRQLAN